MRRFFWYAVALVLVVPQSASSEQTKGGIYLDNISIVNNSKPVFTANFDSGKLDGWNANQSGVELVPSTGQTGGYSLYMNRHDQAKAWTNCAIRCADVGTLEFSAYVYLPRVKDQYVPDQRASSTTTISLRGMSRDHYAELRIGFTGRDSVYSLELLYNKIEQGQPPNGERHVSQGPAIAPGKWTLLAMKLNPATSTLTVTIDGQQAISCEYFPDRLPTLSMLGISSWFGDQPPAKQ